MVLVVLVVLVVVVAASCSSASAPDSKSGTEHAEKVPKLEVFPLTPVPAHLAKDYQRCQDFIRRGYFTHATGLYETLVKNLEKEWGDRNSALVSYHYNYCLCIKSAGAYELVLKAAQKAIERWPTSLQHRVLVATSLLGYSRAKGGIAPGTAEAVAVVTRPEFHELLKERLRIEPADLHVQWGDVLFRAQETQKALDEIEVALKLSPHSYRARHLKANCLVALEHLDEALPILEKLFTESRAPPENPDEPPRPRDLQLEALLVTSYAQTGRAKEAWSLITEVRAEIQKRGVRTPADRELVRKLAIFGATALNQLSRFAEARDNLLPVLLETPNDRQGLQPFIESMRGLGLAETEAALARRREELATFLYESEQATASRAAGRRAQEIFHEVRALLATDRLGEAEKLVRDGQAKYPNVADLHLLSAEIHLRLARVGAITKTLDGVMRSSRSNIVGLALARLRHRQGLTDVAKSMVEAVEKNLPPDGQDNARIRGMALRIRAEIGEHEKVLARVKEGLDEKIDAANPEIALLFRIENLLREGDLDAARTALSQSFTSLNGGESWAGVLRSVVEWISAKPGETLTVDLSDFLDHPDLCSRLRRVAIVRENAQALARLDLALEILEKRNALIARMKEQSNDAVLSIWKELARLYSDVGAPRKAREVAWFLWNSDRRSLSANLLLAKSLSRREEVLPRLAALERAARTASQSAEVESLLRETRAALGVTR